MRLQFANLLMVNVQAFALLDVIKERDAVIISTTIQRSYLKFTWVPDR